MTNINIPALREAAKREAAALVRQAAEPRGMGDTIERCIERAARRLGWSFSRAENVWRGEARRLESWEMDQLRAMSQRRSDAAAPTGLPATF